jgi:hypothetical protein
VKQQASTLCGHLDGHEAHGFEWVVGEQLSGVTDAIVIS